MSKYPTGSQATSLIEFQRERIKSMERRIVELENENALLKSEQSKIERLRLSAYQQILLAQW